MGPRARRNRRVSKNHAEQRQLTRGVELSLFYPNWRVFGIKRAGCGHGGAASCGWCWGLVATQSPAGKANGQNKSVEMRTNPNQSKRAEN